MRNFSIFRYRGNRDGKGVAKGEDLRPTLRNFFKFFWRKLSHLLSLNILMLFQVIPIVGAVLAYFMTSKTPSQTSVIFAPVYGVSLIKQSPATSLLLSLLGIPLNIPVFNNPSYWIIAVCAVFLILTLGWQTVGSAYVLRNLVRGDAVFVMGDYFYAIRRNFKQGFLFGLLDAALLSTLAVDFLYYSHYTGAFWRDVLFWILTAIALLYLMMRPYIYVMLITFDMKIWKMFKNALIFSILGVKRNLMAVVGIVLLFAIHFLLIVYLLPLGIAIPLILPVVYILAATGFIIVYAIYPVIDRYMIAPYRKENEAEDDSDAVES